MKPPVYPPARVEPAALALLKAAQDALFSLRTYQAECVNTSRNTTYLNKENQASFTKSTLIAAKPNKMRNEEWHHNFVPWANVVSGKTERQVAKDQPDFVRVCNGTVYWQQSASAYDVYRADPRLLSPWGGIAWQGFYAKEQSVYAEVQKMLYPEENPARLESHRLLELRLTGREKIDGVLCDKVRLRSVYRSKGGGDTAASNLKRGTRQAERPDAYSFQESRTYYIGVSDKIIRRASGGFSKNWSDNETPKIGPDLVFGFVWDEVVRHLRVNAPIVHPTKVFTYIPAPQVSHRKVPLLAFPTVAPTPL